MPDHPNPKRLLPVIIAYLHVFSSVDAILKLKLIQFLRVRHVTTFPQHRFADVFDDVDVVGNAVAIGAVGGVSDSVGVRGAVDM